ncbi:MAG TPA: hypothetical protein VJ772_07105 [Nitrososphaeraceae archaeon]|nr:hypothetical protein [Nitrososphaeraceae archaeon]
MLQRYRKERSIRCFDSATCTNTQEQTEYGTTKQYNIGYIDSTCVNPGGSNTE